MVLAGDLPHTWRRALVDVTQQARPATALGALEHTLGARAHGEDPQQGVQGVPDGPRLGIGAEVAVARFLLPACDHGPRDVLGHRDRQVRIGLVVPVGDVEPGRELFDPRVLELQGLELRAHHGPLHRRGRGDHGAGLGRELVQGREVGREPVAQVLGLAHVDHTAVFVPEPVDPRIGGDVLSGRSVARRVSHARRPSARTGTRCTRPCAVARIVPRSWS